MIRTIIFLLIFGAVCFYGYRYWQQHGGATTEGQNGDYSCSGCLNAKQEASYDKEDHGETADGNSQHKNESARVGAEEAVNGTSSAAPTGTSSMVPPSQTSIFAQPSAATTSSATASSAPAASLPVVPMAGQPIAGSVLPPDAPAHDSEPANSPNGMRFAGSGTYQWYRQGDLTYRIDTASGKSCIIYATKRQWHDPLVYNNGCGRTT